MAEPRRIVSDITLDLLPPAQRELAEVLGLESYLLLVEFVNGDSLYIPKYSSLLEGRERIQRDEEIIQKFDGFNWHELAKEYDLSVRSIYNIIPRSIRSEKRNSPIDGQVTLAELLDAGA